MQHTLTHKSSCRLAESIADAERLRIGRREQLHLLGPARAIRPFNLKRERAKTEKENGKIAVNFPTRITIPLQDAAGFF